MASRMGALLHREPAAPSTPPDAPDAPDADAATKTEPVVVDDAAAAAAADDDDGIFFVVAARPPPVAAEGVGKPIEYGDLVIVYEGFNKAKAVTIAPRAQYQNKYGNFFHVDWVGKPLGSKVFGRGENGGHVWLLAPTPELWTKVLPHRTQILYLPDISLITLELELRPGSVVIESGTGSGSLTHSLIRAVAGGGASTSSSAVEDGTSTVAAAGGGDGHVWSFEFNAVRAASASAEIVAHGLSKHCTVTCRDVERDGFPAALEGCADAVFLDLPGPWKCIESVARCLRRDGVVCAFSPCIEQVQRTCEALERHGFGDARTVELLGREHDVEVRELQTDLSKSQPKLKSGWKRESAKKAARKRTRVDGDGDGDGGAASDATAPKSVVVSYPRQASQSHTGYLTFARLTPYVDPEVARKAREDGCGGGGGRRGGRHEYVADANELSE